MREDLPKEHKIDVITLTKNSEKYLDECLKSIYKIIPLNNLIIIDGFSKDKTKDIILKYQKQYQNIIFVSTHALRGKAREIGIKLVKTKWFAFIDSDVILYSNWFKEVSSYIDNGVGLIGSILPYKILRQKEHQDYEIAIQSFRKYSLKTRKGTTSNLLLRTKLVKDIYIPDFINSSEERIIISHFLKKGYKQIHINKVLCKHYKKHDFIDFKTVGAYYRLFKRRNIYNLLFNIIKIPLKTFFVIYKSKNPKVTNFILKLNFNILYGWLKWKKILKV